MQLGNKGNCPWVDSCCSKWLNKSINAFTITCFSQSSSLSLCVSCLKAKWHCAENELFIPTAGTISGEEVPIVSKTNIKEYRDSFSCEKFTFRSNPNITFYVYVSNFSWPIKIQVRTVFVTHTVAYVTTLVNVFFNSLWKNVAKDFISNPWKNQH